MYFEMFEDSLKVLNFVVLRSLWKILIPSSKELFVFILVQSVVIFLCHLHINAPSVIWSWDQKQMYLQSLNCDQQWLVLLIDSSREFGLRCFNVCVFVLIKTGFFISLTGFSSDNLILLLFSLVLFRWSCLLFNDNVCFADWMKIYFCLYSECSNSSMYLARLKQYLPLLCHFLFHFV